MVGYGEDKLYQSKRQREEFLSVFITNILYLLYQSLDIGRGYVCDQCEGMKKRICSVREGRVMCMHWTLKV